MPQSTTGNRRIVLNARPRRAPTPEDFRVESDPVPEPVPGQILLRTLYLSLDPYMRGRMSDSPAYAAPVAIGEVMVGGTVSPVEVSKHGDLPGRLAAACPKGIDVYFENVGGAVFDAVLPLLNAKAREDAAFGLENAPEAFIGLLQGRNFGKLVIQLAHK
jgi:NADPH-dependent curcumin reductase CurA